MGQIENMNPEDVKLVQEQIKALNEQKGPQEVPMTFKTFPMEDLEFAKRLTAIEDKLDKLANQLSHIFGTFVLIKGQWKDVKGWGEIG